jgi:excisionase family DNA binding protein
MSSNLSVNRVCEVCKMVFVAKTTVTKYCSTNCRKTKHREKGRELHNEKKKADAILIENHIFDDIKNKDFLTVKNAAQLLNMSAKTVYRLIEREAINSFQFSERKTLIRRSDIEKYFDHNLKEIAENKIDPLEEITIYNSYTIQEVVDKFQISNGALYNIIKRFNIPKKNQGKFVLVKREDIDSIFT